MNEIDFDVKPLVEIGGDFCAVCLWKITYGMPFKSPMAADIEPAYVLAISAQHAIAISDWWYTETGDGTDEEGPMPILSVEGIAATILVDPQMINSSGVVSYDDSAAYRRSKPT